MCVSSTNIVSKRLMNETGSVETQALSFFAYVRNPLRLFLQSADSNLE